jgi:hypothetical protein
MGGKKWTSVNVNLYQIIALSMITIIIFIIDVLTRLANTKLQIWHKYKQATNKQRDTQNVDKNKTQVKKGTKPKLKLI